MLSINTPAPDFSLLDQNGDEHSLSEYQGSWILVYFYPKDDTPGCTKEACMIRDVYDGFEEEDIIVMGISKDSVKSHKKFEEKYNLPFILLADTSKSVIEQYQADKFPGTKRISYLINPDGLIAHAFEKVTPADHADEVLATVRSIKQNLY
ncbi:peroxiredoxin [Candidatus Nomurabacteria bacterium]|nr:peroxiredoxin [Candidatus Nomurabacteria bacterium]